MKLTWAIIQDNLKDYCILYSRINEPTKLSGVQILSNQLLKYKSDSLLVGKISEIKNLPSTDTDMLNLLYITDVKIKEIPNV